MSEKKKKEVLIAQVVLNNFHVWKVLSWFRVLSHGLCGCVLGNNACVMSKVSDAVPWHAGS